MEKTINKHEIPCEIISDLLPLYVDGLTSDGTNRQIRHHLETCEGCRENYQRMKETLAGEEAEKQRESGQEIDYLKKLRRKGFKRILLGAALAIVFILAAAFLKLFVIGYPSNSYQITYADVRDQHLALGGSFYDSASVYNRYKMIERRDGTTELIIYVCLPSAWNRSGVFNLDIDLSQIKTDLAVNGLTVKRDGTVITKLANELYQAKHPYVGDMPANGRLAQLLRIGDTLGNYNNELQTSQEPYGWTFDFGDRVADPKVFEAKMKSYSSILMALIDNLYEVSWSYMVETDSGPTERRRKTTREECSDWLGTPLKNFSDSPERVQKLLDLLAIR